MKNKYFRPISQVLSVAFVTGLSFAFAGLVFAADPTLSITTINGVPPTGQCLTGDITIIGSGSTGQQGGTWHLAVGWGDGSTTTPTITSGSLTGGNTSFGFSATHTITGASTGLTIILYHSQESGNDGKVIIISQCTPTFTGKVTINKEVIGSDKPASDFAPFKVGSTTVTLGAETDINEGTYQVTEATDQNYTQSFSPSCPSGTVTVSSTTPVTCTITNTFVPPPTVATSTLTVIKNVTNNNGGTATSSDFTLTLFKNSATTTFPGSATGTVFSFNATTTYYSVGENATSTYAASFGVNCSGTLNPGQNKTCTVTNDDIASTTASSTLTVIKHVINNNGGTAVASDFEISITGATTTTFQGNEQGTSFFDVFGDYNVTEGDHEGYAVSYSEDCDGAIEDGENKICTITNNDAPALLTLVKHAIAGEGTFQFELTGATVATTSITASNGYATSSEIALNVGTTTILELVNADFDFTDASCVYENTSLGNSVAYGEEIHVENGDHVTCTFTNTSKRGAIRVIKNVVGSDGSTDVSDNHTFSVTLHATGTVATSTKTFSEATSTLFTGLPAGTYTISELSDPDFDLLSISPDNDATTTDAQVTVQNGTTTVVTITNKQHEQVSNPSNDGGGSGGGGGGGSSGSRRRGSSGGQVLGAATGPTIPADFCPYLTSYLKYGAANDLWQVIKLQVFLNVFNNAGLTVNGIFDLPTLYAVNSFQSSYPVPIKQMWLDAGIPMPIWPTGYVYKTTSYQINKMLCPNTLPPILP